MFFIFNVVDFQGGLEKLQFSMYHIAATVQNEMVTPTYSETTRE